MENLLGIAYIKLCEVHANQRTQNSSLEPSHPTLEQMLPSDVIDVKAIVPFENRIDTCFFLV